MGVHVSPHPEPLPATLSPSHPSGLSQCTSFECPVSCIELRLVIYFTYGNIMFQCYSLKSSHSHLLSQSPKVCALYLCLFCCLAYRVIVTIFLNSLYICFKIILHCVYVTQLSYPFICRWTSRLLPCPGYCKQCCDEHWGACISFNSGFLSV